MKKSIYLISILVLMMSYACKNNSDLENHDPNPLVSPTSIDATSGEDTVSFHLVCSENPDGAYLYDEDGDNVTVVIDPETPLPDSMSFNEETGVIIVRRTTDISGTLRFWTIDDMEGSTEDQPLTVTYNITQWTAEPGETAVYVAGYYNDGSRDIACYWKDGVKFDLHINAGHNSQAKSIYVLDDNIYVAGYYNDGSVVTACYWKNGFETSLDLSDVGSGLGDSKATEIVIDTDTMYISGHYIDTDQVLDQNACYWSGSSGALSRTDLINADYTQAEGIFRSAGVTYTSGYYDSTDGAGVDIIPCYWKDSSIIDLPLDGGGEGVGSSIVISGNTAYVAGYIDDKSCYWKDPVSDTDPNDIVMTSFITASSSFGNSVALSGTDLYVAGRYYESKYKAGYWKVSGSTTLTELEQYTLLDGSANSVSVTSSDVYFAGSDIIIGGIMTACYWKQSSPTEKITLHSTTDAEAHSIFVE